MKIIKIQQSELPSLFDIGLENLPCVIYTVYDSNFAWILHDRNCNFEVIKEENIPYVEIPNAPGSTIIAVKDDIDFAIFGPQSFCERIMDTLIIYVSQLANGGTIVNNDMMYGPYKYGGISKMKMAEDKYFYATHISNYIDKELIQKICTKTQLKLPEELPTKMNEQDILNMLQQLGVDN